MDANEMTSAALAFTAARKDMDSVEYQAARGRFYAAILEANNGKTKAPPAKYKPRSLGDFLGQGAMGRGGW